jgi:hypothetical protein
MKALMPIRFLITLNSTIEAQLITLALAGKQMNWMRDLLFEKTNSISFDPL